MKKSKKYVYPFIFSLCFLAIFYFLIFVLNALVLPGDVKFEIAGAALLAWVLVISPIYSIWYNKHITKEKFKFLFATYNALVISLVMILPFLLIEYTHIYTVGCFFWLLAWSILSLIFTKNKNI